MAENHSGGVMPAAAVAHRVPPLTAFDGLFQCVQCGSTVHHECIAPIQHEVLFPFRCHACRLFPPKPPQRSSSEIVAARAERAALRVRGKRAREEEEEGTRAQQQLLDVASRHDSLLVVVVGDAAVQVTEQEEQEGRMRATTSPPRGGDFTTLIAPDHNSPNDATEPKDCQAEMQEDGLQLRQQQEQDLQRIPQSIELTPSVHTTTSSSSSDDSDTEGEEQEEEEDLDAVRQQEALVALAAQWQRYDPIAKVAPLFTSWSVSPLAL